MKLSLFFLGGWLALASGVANGSQSLAGEDEGIHPKRPLIGRLGQGPLIGGSGQKFSRQLESRALAYFLDHYHPQTGLIRDRAANFGPTPRAPRYEIASIAATGFGLAVYADAARRGLMSRDLARKRIRRTLAFADSRLFRFRGWFHHFVDWRTGKGIAGREVSTVDTAWFVAGALAAAQVFPGGDIEALAQEIYRRLDFDAMRTHGGRLPQKMTLSMGWTPETGYLAPQWKDYAEHLVLIALGLAHPSDPLPIEAWAAMDMPVGEPLGHDLPLFVHQYSHLFIPPDQFHDGKRDFFANSRAATVYQRRAFKGKKSYETYRRGFWGLSASDSPDHYQAFSPDFHNGTVCPGCVAASAMFTPGVVLSDLATWKRQHPRSWGRYGFSDALNLDRSWIGSDVIGITVGAVYLALANVSEKGGLWRVPPAPVLRGLERVRSQ